MTEKKLTGHKSPVMKWLFERTAGMRTGMLLLCIWSLLYAVIGVSFALICRGIVDSATARDPEGIKKYALLLFGAVLLQFALRIAVGFTEERLRSRLEMNMRGELLRALMNKEFSAVSGFHSGELLNKLCSDISVSADGLTAILPLILNSAARIICAAVLLIMLDSRFAAVYIAGGAAVFGITAAFRGKMKRLHTDVQEKEDAMRSIMQETVENLLTVKVFGAEEKMLSRVNEKQTAHYRSRLKRRAVSVAAGSGLDLAFRLGYILALIMGAVWIFGGTMTYGTLTAVLQLVNQLQSPFAGLSSVLQRYYGMLASGERIREMYELPEEAPGEAPLDYEELDKIRLENVSFSYGENEVLRNVSIDIEKGSVTSLTGISGGGKSTLFLLLLGAYQPNSGRIAFVSDKGELAPGRETRGLFAYVPQGNQLFSGTIAENIAFLKDGADRSEIMNAAEIACASEFISSLPDGLDTKVGENGFGLSEGQAQRIAVARAILGNAPILLLDEATAALDEATEARLLENISGLRGKTVIIVTHRSAALKICSRHLILKDGKIDYE